MVPLWLEVVECCGCGHSAALLSSLEGRVCEAEIASGPLPPASCACVHVHAQGYPVSPVSPLGLHGVTSVLGLVS